MYTISMTKPTSKKPKTSNAWEWSPVDQNSVLRVDQSHRILLNGEEITATELENLRAEVGAFKNFRLWRLFDNTLRERAIEIGFVKAENWEQTSSGKMMLYNLGTMKSIMAAIEKMPPLHTAAARTRAPLHQKKSP